MKKIYNPITKNYYKVFPNTGKKNSKPIGVSDVTLTREFAEEIIEELEVKIENYRIWKQNVFDLFLIMKNNTRNFEFLCDCNNNNGTHTNNCNTKLMKQRIKKLEKHDPENEAS